MGQEIDSSRFTQNDFDIFSDKLKKETEYLAQAFRNQQFSETGNIIGYEIEAWLVGQSGSPIPINHTFLEKLDNPLVVHELAAFNIELNSNPLPLRDKALSSMEDSLRDTWSNCRKTASELSVELMMIGILPSIQDRHLSIENMSKLNRYRALNEQLMKHRHGQPLQLDISGRQHINTSHTNVMLESACTSFQLHLQTPLHKAARIMNLASIVSGPMVAVSANSPYFLGKDLWDETRIPLFEQSVHIEKNNYSRVTFGHAYINESIMEHYHDNLKHYPVLVPMDMNSPVEKLRHLAFHNGTIWRWNRPLIGFDEQGEPHFRIEHRVIPAGPSVVDSVANAALFFGLINGLEQNADALIEATPFTQAKENFYRCARHGLAATVQWGERGEVSIKELYLDELLPAASEGLANCDIDADDARKYMNIIQQRIKSGLNGASWQRQWVAAHGCDMQRLTCSYMQRQNSGKPVHEWSI